VDADRNVVLITGDHPVTARAIARQLGLSDDVRVVTGSSSLPRRGRVRQTGRRRPGIRPGQPEQKVQIVPRCSAAAVTAMVGDGANDARNPDVRCGIG